MHPIELYKQYSEAHSEAYKKVGEGASVEFQLTNDPEKNRFWHLGIALDVDRHTETANYIDISTGYQELLTIPQERFTFFLHLLTEENYIEAIEAWGDIQSDMTLPVLDFIVRLPFDSQLVPTLIEKLRTL